MPALFSDHMVLQRASEVPVWGWAQPGEEVSVTLGEVSAQARTNQNGIWFLQLNLEKTPQGPHTMEISGENRIEIKDVLVGQVWLAAGGGNMEFALRHHNSWRKNRANAANLQVREFRVTRAAANEPQTDVGGEWVVSQSDAVGKFSAVAYFFAKRLNEALEQPVGIINSSATGSVAESFISKQTLAEDAELEAGASRRETYMNFLPRRQKSFAAAFTSWANANGMADAASESVEDFIGEDVDIDTWKPFDGTARRDDDDTKEKMPLYGVFWLRRQFDIPAADAGKELVYRVYENSSFATFYLNGKRFAGPEFWQRADFEKLQGDRQEHLLVIPGKYVKEGKNVLSVRLYSPLGESTYFGLFNSVTSHSYSVNVHMDNEWYAKAEKQFTPNAEALASAPRMFKAVDPVSELPSRFFNGMIHPLAPYRLAGVICYEGQGNMSRAAQHQRTFSLMIEDWRKLWREPHLPFYFCQFANFGRKPMMPEQSLFAELREAQSQALKLPNTGQAVLIDLGEADNSRPFDKTEVGDRLARLALADTYGRKGFQASGPVLKSQRLDVAKMVLDFERAGPGSELVARELPQTHLRLNMGRAMTERLWPTVPGSQLQGFAICGKDGKWHWAQAKIEGSHRVVVWSPEVRKPVAVRYAWADNPTCNLYNAAGLPASPFRTDTFDLSTSANHY